MNLMQSEEFLDIAEKDYGLTITSRKDGSFDMVQKDTEDQDFLFPASQLAQELYHQQGKSSSRDEIIFNTPVVIYTYRPVVDAFIKEGLVTVDNEVHSLDMETLARYMAEGKQWSDIGLENLYGSIIADTTDPNASNSGNQFLGLLANALNGGTVRNQVDLDKVLPDLIKIYNNIGYMQTSSSDLFNQFMNQGMGAYPMIAAYENQLLEFSVANPESYDRIKDDIVILYPRPTVWSSHVLISLNSDTDILIDALQDPKTQELAWKNHGFRPGAGSGDSDGETYQVPGVADSIPSVIDMPPYSIMEQLMAAVRQ